MNSKGIAEHALNNIILVLTIVKKDKSFIDDRMYLLRRFDSPTCHFIRKMHHNLFFTLQSNGNLLNILNYVLGMQVDSAL